MAMSSSEGCLQHLSEVYADQIVERPRTFMAMGLLIPVALSIAGITAYPLAIDSTGGSFIPKSSIIGQREDSLLIAEEHTRFNPLRRTDAATVVQAVQSSPSYYLSLDFWARDGSNVFTPARLEYMRSVEHIVSKAANYSAFCLKPIGHPTCAPPHSLLPYFFAEELTGCPGFLRPDGQASDLVTSVDETLLRLIDPTRNETYCAACVPPGTPVHCQKPGPAAVDFAVGVDFGYNASQPGSAPSLVSDVTKTTFSFGLPLAGYNSSGDRHADQIRKVEEFIKTIIPEIPDGVSDVGLSVLLNTQVFTDTHLSTVIFNDAILVVASVVIVWLYVWFHTASFWNASFGILHVVLSFPCAYLVTQGIMDLGGTSVLNFMSLFIILGIGADDIFIFVDAWKQSRVVRFGDVHPTNDVSHKETKKWLKLRLAWAYQRSARAMLITSLTTGCAFLMNMTSSIVTIQAFGFFTAMMVFINYLEVITVFPAVVMVQQMYIRELVLPCLPRPGTLVHERETADMEEMLTVGEVGEVVDGAKAFAEATDGLRYLERWFHHKYGPFMIRWRAPLLALFVLFLGVTIGFATQLGPANEATSWLPPTDPIQELLNIETNKFKTKAFARQISFTHGLELIDRSGINVYNAGEIGTPRFNKDFDPSTPQAQQAYVDQCQRFRSLRFVRNQEVLCPMDALKNYVEKELNSTFPVPQETFVATLARFCDWFERTNGPAKDLDESNEGAETRKFRQTFEEKSIFHTIRWSKQQPETLLFMVTVINSTLVLAESGSVVRNVYDYWQDVVKGENNLGVNIESGLDHSMQTTANYLDMEVQDTLFKAAFTGIGASLGLAFAIMIVVSRDLLISALSIICVSGVVVALFACMAWMGWSLGVIESVCMTILVGLSVDYTIHLAQAYRESTAKTRERRIIDCLTTMGISVISASATSILSATVLFFTTIRFFVKFGIFVALTIGLSTVFSFGLFIVLLAFVGQHEERDDCLDCWRWMTRAPAKDRNIVTQPFDAEEGPTQGHLSVTAIPQEEEAVEEVLGFPEEEPGALF